MLGRDAPRRSRNEQAQSEYEEVEMQVRDAMTKDPLAIRIDATIQEAAAGMRQADVGALPVVSDENTLVGIVTDRDLAIRALAEALSPETPVGQIMTRNCVTVDASDELEDALSLMRSEQIRRLPVVQNERLVGIVAQADVIAVSDAPELADTPRHVSEPAATEANDGSKLSRHD